MRVARFLKRGVDEQVVGIGLAPRVEAIDDEGVHRPFDRAHVHPAGETQVGAEQIAVAVLLGRPAPEPSRPGSRAGALVVVDQSVERNGVTGERFFGDHVAHEDHQQLVGDGCGGDAEPVDLITPARRLEVGQVVGGLPRPIDRVQQPQVTGNRRFNRTDHFVALRQGVVASVDQVSSFHDLRHSSRRCAGGCGVRPRGGFTPRLVEEDALRTVLQQQQLKQSSVAFEKRRFA